MQPVGPNEFYNDSPDQPPFDSIDLTHIDPDLILAALQLAQLRPELSDSIYRSLQTMSDEEAAPSYAEQTLAEWEDEEILEAARESNRGLPLFLGRMSELTAWDRKYLLGLRIRL